jgi:hypothetical protein
VTPRLAGTGIVQNRTPPDLHPQTPENILPTDQSRRDTWIPTTRGHHCDHGIATQNNSYGRVGLTGLDSA